MSVPEDVGFGVRAPLILLILDQFNKWCQGQQALQNGVHVTRLRQVRESETQQDRVRLGLIFYITKPGILYTI